MTVLGDLVAARTHAVDAVTEIEEQLTALVRVADALAAQQQRHASDELRRALTRAFSALHFLADELTLVEVIEHHVKQQPYSRSPS